MTTKQKESELIRQQKEYELIRLQNRTMDVATILHREGFRNVLIDQIGLGAHLEDLHYRIIVEESEVSPDRFQKLVELAEKENCSIMLVDMWANQIKYSRIGLWVKL